MLRARRCNENEAFIFPELNRISFTTPTIPPTLGGMVLDETPHDGETRVKPGRGRVRGRGASLPPSVRRPSTKHVRWKPSARRAQVFGHNYVLQHTLPVLEKKYMIILDDYPVTRYSISDVCTCVFECLAMYSMEGDLRFSTG